MSDLQILTGLSILVSGYSQLRCGLSIYHWQVLVYLAWFSSITHLSCLTFLRNYLYNRQGERTWRLLGMGAIVIMLMIALLPTGNNLQDTPPAQYAICMLKDPKPVRGAGPEFSSMVMSVLLLGLGFLSRVVKLHRNLSVNTVTTIREYLSVPIRKILHGILQSCERHFIPATRRHILRYYLYRPTLAAFLAGRVALDLWSSLIFEVKHFSTASM